MSDALIWVGVFLLVACLIFLLIAHNMIRRYWGDPTALSHALLWLYLTLFFIFITLVVLIAAVLARCGSLSCSTKAVPVIQAPQIIVPQQASPVIIPPARPIIYGQAPI